MTSADKPLTALDWEEILRAGSRALIGSELRPRDLAAALDAMARKAREIAARP